MAADRPTWRDRYPDQVTCVRCLQVQDQADLDRLLWCDRCRVRARRRAVLYGWLGGLLIGAAVAAYVWLVIEPTVLVGAWVATVVAAVWIGSKVCRELAYGVMRFRNARAAEAVPPDAPPEGSS